MMSHVHSDNLEPAGFLKENIGLLPVGRVLDVAMGNGRNAIYLAQLGFRVEGVDNSRKTVSTATEAARREGVNIKAVVADLEHGYRIEKTAYDVIICFNYLQHSLIPTIKEGLRLGGIVVYETFIVDQARFGHPHNPEYLLEYNELLRLFRDFRCLRYREGIIEARKAVASIVAQRV